MILWLSLIFFSSASHAAPCDSALAEAVKAGAIEASEIEWRQLCQLPKRKDDESKHNIYLCLFIGPPPARKHLDLGEKSIVVALTEDAISKEKLKSLLGVWAPYQGKSLTPGMKRKTITVSVNNMGAVGTKKEFGRGSTLQEKIEFNKMEEALHYSRFRKSPTDSGPKKQTAMMLDCSKSHSQVEIWAQEKEEARKKRAAGALISVPGNQKVNASGKTRASGISSSD